MNKLPQSLALLLAPPAVLAALTGAGCFKGVDDLGPFPCAADGTCPYDMVCVPNVGCTQPNAGTGTGTGAGGTSTGTQTSTGGQPGCLAEVALPYVLSTNSEVYTFDPQSGTFEYVAALDCGAASGLGPNSMAVDRSGVAWVNYADQYDTQGLIYRFDLAAQACDPTPTVTLPTGWERVGMGFSFDTSAGADNLFVAGNTNPATGYNPGLGMLDTTSGSVYPIGTYAAPLTGMNAELTGTGDGRLYGFFPTSPAEVAGLDKTTTGGAVGISSEKKITGAQPQVWAFAFWGGAFYLFMSDGASNSTVTKYDPQGNTLEPGFGVAPFIIVGAGVSTCAPLSPP